MTDPRCCFCGTTSSFPHRKRPFTWQDVGGRMACDDDCAELERARQAAEAEPRLIEVSEIDGVRTVDQVVWAAEHRRPESPPVRLYLDDVRNPPDDGGGPWTICRTLDEAKALLLRGVDEASLDHDLGQCESCASDLGPNNCPHVPTGLELVAWMVVHGAWPRMKPRVHSANRRFGPVMVEMIERHWRAR